MSKKQTDKRENVFLTSTPALSGELNKFTDDKDLSDISATTTDKIKAVPKQKITIDLVIGALQAVGIKKKGASLVAIQKYLSANPDGPDFTLPRTKASLKKIILKAIEDGVLKRSPQHPNAKGVQGSFMVSSLPNKKAKSPSKDTLKKTKAPSSKVSTVDGTAPGPSKTSKERKLVPKSNKAKSKDLTEKQKANVVKAPKKELDETKPVTKKKPEKPIKTSTAETKTGLKTETQKKKKATVKQDKVLKDQNKNPTEKKSKVAQKKIDLPGKSEVSIKRKDLSDTELELSRRPLPQFKAYSSDTELETSKRLEKIKKVTKPKKKESKFLNTNRTDENTKSNLETFDFPGPEIKESSALKKPKKTVKKR